MGVVGGSSAVGWRAKAWILRESVERLKTEVEQRIQGSRTGERPAVVRSRAFLASMDVRRLRRVRSVPGREETSVTWALSGLEARRYTTEHAWR